MAAAPDGQNSLVAMATNNLTAGTVTFPTAITGVAYNQSNGNTAFGFYGERQAAAQGVVPAAEIAAFQDGAPAPSTVQFNNLIGTTQTLAKGIQITAGSTAKVSFTGDISSGSATIANLPSTTGLIVGQLVEGTGIPWGARISSIGSNSMIISQNVTATTTTLAMTSVSPAAIATEVGREGSTLGVFQNGHFLSKNSVLNWSYFQDASASQGPFNGMYLAIPGNGINLVLKAAAIMAANNTVL